MNAERYIAGVGFVPLGAHGTVGNEGDAKRGIFRLRIAFNVTPLVRRYVFVYVLAADSVYLIDTGVKGAEADVTALLAALGRPVTDIKAIFLTHSHPDHIGAAGALVRLTGARVYACGEEREWIENIDVQFRDRPIPNFYGLVGGPVKIDVTVGGGDVIVCEPNVTLRAIATHGHSAGSTSYFYAEERALFIGDALPVRGDIPIYVSVADSLKTLDVLSGIKADCVCPAWDTVYTSGEFRRKLADARALLGEIDACVSSESAAAPQESADAIVSRACAKLGMAAFAANPLFLRSLRASLPSRRGDLTIVRAAAEDLPSILALQYLAFAREAELLNDPHIPPLRQTLPDLTAEFVRGVVLKAVRGGELIGSVRAYCDGDTAYIGKLIVRPDAQGQGVGTALLAEIESCFPGKRRELFTSARSGRNIKLYERLGYKRFKETAAGKGLRLVYLEKSDNQCDP